ncbi:LytR/AlgR family response regulator transcription factor [Ruminococcus flavefaciens]|uniref:LytR/AlgR family response regulator transcription factor n=1 Tax=Ruminococcus flavefaciens TaxID=1265 RepID=UPI0026EBDB9F|nr:LytTR family DNA-binding domain-containing protein [Ruminococcus flavefaciens]MDD7515504.1 LytTR family DNA-binding domain-containing protein [Ruminococcus flavefaciens]MDY5690197.1 LytTR family DNA-binding domain-containing protein [Ruminococcus flavefaciens]
MKQLGDTLHEYYRNTRYLIASDGSKEEKIPTDDILYIEVFSHKLLLHTKSGDYFTKGTLSEIEAQLSDLLFARLDKSSIVNITNIDYIRKNEIILINGDTLFPSRNHIKNIKQCFMDHSRSRWS